MDDFGLAGADRARPGGLFENAVYAAVKLL